MIPREIILDGTAVDMGRGKERYVCYIDGVKLLLPGTEFFMLSKLVIETDLNGACDIAALEFTDDKLASRYFWRLRKTLKEALPNFGGWPIYENRRDRKYCLFGRPSMSIKLSEGMKKNSDSRIALDAQKWFARKAPVSSQLSRKS